MIKECLVHESCKTLYALNYVIRIVCYVHALLLLTNYVLNDPLCIMTIFVVFVNFYAYGKFH